MTVLITNRRHWMRDMLSMLDAGCWMLDVGCWMLNAKVVVVSCYWLVAPVALLTSESNNWLGLSTLFSHLVAFLTDIARNAFD